MKAQGFDPSCPPLGTGGAKSNGGQTDDGSVGEGEGEGAGARLDRAGKMP